MELASVPSLLSRFLLMAIMVSGGISQVAWASGEDFDSDNLMITERIHGIYDPMVHIDVNQVVISYIRGYVERRPAHTAQLLGRAELYFPMFEQWLEEEGVPVQLKYLAVLESALQPRATSRAGARGPWQFMPATGKIFHLNQTSFIDDRCDLEKSTRAAARYLKQLYNMYDDWALAFCAYNAGPGRVNRAIRMARTNRFDQVIRFLPRETQNYVPAFISAMYVMNFHAMHGIEITQLPQELFRVHKVRVFDYTPFDMLAEAMDMDEDHLRLLNPSFVRDAVPAAPGGYVMLIPERKKEAFFNFRPYAIAESSFQGLRMRNIDYHPTVTIDNPELEYITRVESVRKLYTVRSGDNLSIIARRTGTSVNQLRNWNNLRSNTIHPNQRLVYYQRESVKVPVYKEISPESDEALASAEDMEADFFHELPGYSQLQQKISGGKLMFNVARNTVDIAIADLVQTGFHCIPGRTGGSMDVCRLWDNYHLANGRQTIREIAKEKQQCEIQMIRINGVLSPNEPLRAGSIVKMPELPRL